MKALIAALFAAGMFAALSAAETQVYTANFKTQSVAWSKKAEAMKMTKGENLAVEVVGQSVDDGDRTVFCQILHVRLFERADHDRVEIAREHARRILDGLSAPDLQIAVGEKERVTAKLVHSHFKGDARASAGLFKDHHQHLAAEGSVWRTCLLQRFDFRCAAQHRVEFVFSEICELQKVSDCHFCLPIFLFRDAACAVPHKLLHCSRLKVPAKRTHHRIAYHRHYGFAQLFQSIQHIDH